MESTTTTVWTPRSFKHFHYIGEIFLHLFLSPLGHTPGEPLSSCPPNDPRTNKELVLKAYQEVFGDHITDNIDKYFAPDYIQHNPLASDGKNKNKST
jgi:hypothetical protein